MTTREPAVTNDKLIESFYVRLPRPSTSVVFLITPQHTLHLSSLQIVLLQPSHTFFSLDGCIDVSHLFCFFLTMV